MMLEFFTTVAYVVIRAKCERTTSMAFLKLADSGYPCRPYLMTPLLNPQTQPERRYNVSH
jgi:hypothetical protein